MLSLVLSVLSFAISVSSSSVIPLTVSNVASIDVDVQGQITAANTTLETETKIQEAQCKLLSGEGGGSEVGASIAVDGVVAQTYMLVQKCCDDVDCSEGSPAWPGDCSLKFDCGSICCES